MTVGPPRSLKARALQLLAQREHSALELRRKLLDHVRRQEAATAVTTGRRAGPSSPEGEAEVDALLAWLQGEGHLSEARFVESRVRARAARYGNLRIRHELDQHGLSLPAADQGALAASELERARAVWARKFDGALPADAAGRARQARFLAGRGFSPDVIRRVLRGADD